MAVPTFEQALAYIKSRYDDEIYIMANSVSAGTQRGVAIFSHVPGVIVSEERGRYIVRMSDKTIDCDKTVASVCLYTMRYLEQGESFIDLCSKNWSNPSATSYTTAIESKVAVDSGQAKVFMGIMEGLVNMPQNFTMLVIGSAAGSYSVSGMSIYLMAEWFAKLGYVAEIHCFDPLEVKQSFVCGEIVVKYFNECFNYKSPYVIKGHPPTVIVDDAWIPVPLPEVNWDSRPGYFSNLVEGYQSFVIREEKRSGIDSYHMVCGLDKHGDVPSAKGGGIMYYNRVEHYIKVFGQSSTYGPYDKRAVRSCLAMYAGEIVVAASNYQKDKKLDPEQNLLKNHRTSRIIMKYYGEDIPVKHEVREQFHYKGHERRAFVNVPPLLKAKQTYGCGCKTCEQISRIASSIVSYSAVDPRSSILSMYSSILGETHDTAMGQKFSRALALIKEAALKQVATERVVKEVSNTLGMKEKTVVRAIRLLANQGVVKMCYTFDRIGRDEFIDKCIVRVGGEDREVYFNKEHTEYYWQFRRFDRRHNEIPMKNAISYLKYNPTYKSAYPIERIIGDPVNVTRVEKFVTKYFPWKFNSVYVHDPRFQYLESFLMGVHGKHELGITSSTAMEQVVLQIGGNATHSGIMSGPYDHLGSLGNMHLWQTKT